jgi:transcriptional antiterminator RfaH
VSSDVQSSKKWYLLASKPREEKRARINLEQQGYTTYLPLVQRASRRGGKHSVRIEPLFPRYLFIQLDKETDNWAPIRSSFGVSGLVGFGIRRNHFIPIPETIIELLRSHEDDFGIHQLEEANWLKKGDKIRITSGPFAEIEGIFVMEDGLHRSMVLIEMMGKQQHITLESSQLASTK